MFLKVISNKMTIVMSSIVIMIYIGQTIFIHHAAMSLRKTALHVQKTKVLDLDILPNTVDEELTIYFNNKFDDKEASESRFQLFMVSFEEVTRLYQEANAFLGLTKLTDMSYEALFPPKIQSNLGQCHNLNMSCIEDDNYMCDDFRLYGEPPEKFDWRQEYGVIGPVLDQDECNDWPFVIAESMESMAAIQSIERDLRLSKRELIDCTYPYGNGCYKGDVSSALLRLCKNRWGVLKQGDYPAYLTSIKNWNCRLPFNPPGLRVKHYCRLCGADVKDILKLIAFHGPVIAIVNVRSWVDYIGGVIQKSCARNHDGTDMDHEVQIVGYDLTAEVPHYIVRNTWGVNFGEDGYVKLAIEGNVCGVRDEITFIKVY